MKKMITAIAVVAVLPAVANAQAQQVPARPGCSGGHDAPAQDSKASPADSHQNHQR